MKNSTRSVTLSTSLAAICLSCASLAAHAGYVDERGTAASPVTSTAAPPVNPAVVLGPEFSQPVWLEAVSQPANAVTLGTALVMLWPITLPALELDMPPELLERKVSWQAGESRQAVLQRAAQQHQIQFRMAGRRISAAIVTPPAIATSARASVAPPAAPARFDIQLGDIRLATTFDRWAKAAGVRVRWDAEQHALVGAPMNYGGDIFDAIAAALSSESIQQSEYPLEVCEYPNEPRLLRITRRGEQAKACPIIANIAGVPMATGAPGVPPRSVGPSAAAN